MREMSTHLCPDPEGTKLFRDSKDFSLGNSGRNFAGATHMNFTAADAPDLSETVSLDGALEDVTAFNRR